MISIRLRPSPLLRAITASCLAMILQGQAVLSGQALRIGVPYLPPASQSISARLYTEEGFEIDLAREIAARLGRPVELIRVPEGESEAALSVGRIELLLERSLPGDAPTVRPASLATGFSSGLAVSMRTDTTIRRWEDLAGRTVCVSEANDPARRLAQRYGATVREERAPARALMRVRTGECDAAIHDEVLLKRLFARGEWRKFSATLPSVQETGLRAVLSAASKVSREELARTIAEIGSTADWSRRAERWAANVAFEVYLDQEAPDCH